MNKYKKILELAFVLQISIFTQQAFADWRGHVDWSFHDTGAPDCPGDYALVGASECLVTGIFPNTGNGNRACLMSKAKIDAEDGNCNGAINKLLITQCHNGKAQAEIRAANKEEVCDYIAPDRHKTVANTQSNNSQTTYNPNLRSCVVSLNSIPASMINNCEQRVVADYRHYQGGSFIENQTYTLDPRQIVKFTQNSYCPVLQGCEQRWDLIGVR
ncbi:hypothetical protein NMM48_12415 [Acinetobacter baumannii]|uniref:hypothetical protein n=1 Tax=Acinetobacter baumannii TaxID=470 RepID=UPI0011A1FE8E|nr:hypothetical protein [Acinetobacter baumannii]MCP9136127.1 hypothetical protein [Acinetobacter baumannii]TWO45075.1 hypothetical protein FQK04_13860 [Acinetobacter baumannii]